MSREHVLDVLVDLCMSERGLAAILAVLIEHGGKVGPQGVAFAINGPQDYDDMRAAAVLALGGGATLPDGFSVVNYPRPFDRRVRRILVRAPGGFEVELVQPHRIDGYLKPGIKRTSAAAILYLLATAIVDGKPWRPHEDESQGGALA
jgi:hypothetical protein